MYSTTLGANTPKVSEISAIQAVYNTDSTGCGDTNPSGACPDPSTLTNIEDCGIGADAGVPTVSHATYETYAPCYYSQVKTSDITFDEQRIYHPNFPYFTVSGAIGNAGMKAEMPARGAPLEGDTFEQIYILKSDGTEDIYTRKGK